MKIDPKKLETDFHLLIIEQLGCDDSDVIPTATFLGDLGADSLDIIEIVMAAEEKWDIEVPDGDYDKFTTVQQALDYLKKKVGIEVIKKELPATKKELLRNAMTDPKFSRVVLRGTWNHRREEMVDGNDKQFDVPAEIGLTFAWGAANIGFGEFVIVTKEGGQIEIKSEAMGQEFVKSALTHWLNSAMVVE